MREGRYMKEDNVRGKEDTKLGDTLEKESKTPFLKPVISNFTAPSSFRYRID